MKVLRRAQAIAAAVVLCATAVVCAATDLAAIREEANSAFNRLDELRARHVKLRGELDRVARKIETLKARQKKSLVSNQELQNELKRSQNLSGQLSDLAHEVSAAESDAHYKNKVLVTALSQMLGNLQQEWADARDVSRRQQLLERMRSLRSEREQLRSRSSAVDPPPISDQTSENPEDLMEQADALRDSGDKVQQQIKELRSRISDLRAERELDMRMADFVRDEALFDEHDRRVRTRAQESPSVSRPAGAVSGRTVLSTPPSSEDRPMSTPGDSVSAAARASDGRPEVGIAPLNRETGDNLPALEQKLKLLETLAKQLEQRARQSEMRAKALQH